jgi:hypothetical protein
MDVFFRVLQRKKTNGVCVCVCVCVCYKELAHMSIRGWKVPRLEKDRWRPRCTMDISASLKISRLETQEDLVSKVKSHQAGRMLSYPGKVSLSALFRSSTDGMRSLY